MPTAVEEIEPSFHHHPAEIIPALSIGGERHIWWNFVSSSLDRIERAKDDWQTHRFEKVPGDEHERIPLPAS